MACHPPSRHLVRGCHQRYGASGQQSGPRVWTSKGLVHGVLNLSDVVVESKWSAVPRVPESARKGAPCPEARWTFTGCWARLDNNSRKRDSLKPFARYRTRRAQVVHSLQHALPGFVQSSLCCYFVRSFIRKCQNTAKDVN